MRRLPIHIVTILFRYRVEEVRAPLRILLLQRLPRAGSMWFLPQDRLYDGESTREGCQRLVKRTCGPISLKQLIDLKLSADVQVGTQLMHVYLFATQIETAGLKLNRDDVARGEWLVPIQARRRLTDDLVRQGIQRLDLLYRTGMLSPQKEPLSHGA